MTLQSSATFRRGIPTIDNDYPCRYNAQNRPVRKTVRQNIVGLTADEFVVT